MKKKSARSVFFSFCHRRHISLMLHLIRVIIIVVMKTLCGNNGD